MTGGGSLKGRRKSAFSFAFFRDKIDTKGGAMEAKEIRAILGDTRVQFSRRYGIPIRTLENWDAGVRRPPDWVLSLLERVARLDADGHENGHDGHETP